MVDIRQQLINIQAELTVAIAALPAPVVNPQPVPGGFGPICWGAKVSKDFRDSVLWIEGKLKVKANYLMPCMGFETGLTFSPSVKNPGSSATGLIQFMDATAYDLGVTTAQLAGMTAVRQLAFVYKYLERFGSDLSHWSLEDTYMSILLPSMIGHPDTEPMNWPSKAYAANRGLDVDKNGVVTKAEATKRVKELYDLGMRPENMA